MNSDKLSKPLPGNLWELIFAAHCFAVSPWYQGGTVTTTEFQMRSAITFSFCGLINEAGSKNLNCLLSTFTLRKIPLNSVSCVNHQSDAVSYVMLPLLFSVNPKPRKRCWSTKCNIYYRRQCNLSIRVFKNKTKIKSTVACMQLFT